MPAARFGAGNPILSIHDVGAGGLSNALPELAHGSGRGARFELARIPVLETGMSPAEIWCNESQERYVLAVAPERLALAAATCASASAARSMCSGEVVADQTLQLAGPGRRLRRRHVDGRAVRQCAADASAGHATPRQRQRRAATRIATWAGSTWPRWPRCCAFRPSQASRS